MKTLLFAGTGEKKQLQKEILIFSNEFNENNTEHDTVILDGIENKHCAIVKDDDEIYKVMDFCSDTKLYIDGSAMLRTLRPLKLYEIRHNDRLYIGTHEIIFINDQELETNTTKRTSFFVPETQLNDYNDNTVPETSSEEHLEIPETQIIDTDMPFVRMGCSDEDDENIEPNNGNDIKKEFLVETQPLLNILPPTTRSRRLKQDEIKPKTVPLSVFDSQTQAFNLETEPVIVDQRYLKTAHPISSKESKSNAKPRVEPKATSFTRKRKKNSALLSSGEESDSDDVDRSKISTITGTLVVRGSQSKENSLDISIKDEFPILSPSKYDSQMMALINASDSPDYYSNLQDIVQSHEEAEIKKNESTKVDAVANSPIRRPKRRLKLFKYSYSDDDDDDD